MKKKIEMKPSNLSNADDKDIKKEIAEITSKMDKSVLAIWASDCAEHVLSYFEEKYPDDDRPRKAIEAARAWVKGDISVGEACSAAFAAHAAARDARDAEEDIACAVARSAGHAAATAHVAGHAVSAADYAAKVNSKERIWQHKKLLELKDDVKN